MGDFFKHLGRAAGSAAKTVEKKILNNPARALEIAANIEAAATSKNLRLFAATAPEVISFVHQRKAFFGEISSNIINNCIQFIIGMTWKN